jgi:hypothetical protein
MTCRFLTAIALLTWIGAAPSAVAAERAGVAAAVRGDVTRARAGDGAAALASNDSVLLDDTIRSGDSSGLQVLFLDQSVLTMGENAELTIDTFVYDPGVDDGAMAVTLLTGGLRFVSGLVSDGAPNTMQIKTPFATIGIRGTIGVAAVLTPSQAQQQFPQQSSQLNTAPGQPVVFAALAGPGPLNQTGANTGSFNFSSPDGSVDLNRPGGAVLATPGAPPVFFIAPPGAIQNLSATSTGGADDGGDASDSGDGGGAQETAEGGGDGEDSAGGASTVVETSNVNADSTATAANIANSVTSSPSASTVPSSVSDLTTFGDVAAAFPGQGTVSSTGDVISGDITGTFQSFIDFSARTVDIQTNNMSQGGGNIGTIVLNGGSGVSVSSTSAGFSISSSNNTGTCSACTGTVAFPSTTSLSLEVNHAGGTGNGTATY